MAGIRFEWTIELDVSTRWIVNYFIDLFSEKLPDEFTIEFFGQLIYKFVLVVPHSVQPRG